MENTEKKPQETLSLRKIWNEFWRDLRKAFRKPEPPRDKPAGGRPLNFDGKWKEMT